MKHNMNLNPVPFEMMSSGKKTIELRLFDEKRRRIKAGDTIEFTNTENAKVIQAKVVCLHCFDDFGELYVNLPLLKCGYTEDDIDTADPRDMCLYYSEEEQRRYGVVGIELLLI